MKKIFTKVLAMAVLGISTISMVACGSSKPSIGVQTGTTGYYYVKGDDDWGFNGFENINVKQYDNAGLAVKDMVNGNINYVVVDGAPAKALVDANKGTKLIEIKLTEEEYAFGVDPKQTELLSQVNQVLGDMMENGDFDKIMNNYFGDGTPAVVKSATKDTAKADTQLVVATNAEFSPFEYVEGNGFSGIDMEIAKYIADALDLELVIENMSFESVCTAVGKNSIDIAMAGLTVNAEREATVTFTDSYYESSQMVIVLENDTKFDECKTSFDIEEVLKSL